MDTNNFNKVREEFARGLIKFFKQVWKWGGLTSSRVYYKCTLYIVI
jgi:hypothetical protein